LSTATSPPVALSETSPREAYDDEPLRAAVAEVFNDWRALLERSLTSAGHAPAEAQDLAELCVAGLEGALMLARVQRSAAPVDRVERRLRALLSRPPTRESS